MADSFDKLVNGINPAADTETEWFSVPTDHSYQGTVRVAHIGTSGAGITNYSMSVVSATGVSVTAADRMARNVELDEGDLDDLTIELGEGKTLVVEADSNNVSFNLFGLDINNA